MAKNDADFKRLGFPSEDMYHFPNIVNIEVYRGKCTCKCVHCPVGRTEPSERVARFGEKGMELELYSKIVDEMSQHEKTTARVHSVGEPLLWKDLPEAMEMNKKKGVRSWLFTSAVTCDKNLLEHVCGNTNIVEVSVNSAEPVDYRETKGVDYFGLVRGNIEHMRKAIARYGFPARLIASRVQSTDRRADEDFVRYWKKTGLVDDAFVRSYHTYNDLIEEIDSYENTKPEHQPCLVHWGRFNINVDGYAVVCFNELFKTKLDERLILGDVKEDTIESIWKGERLNKIRNAEISGDYSNLEFSDAMPCRECYSCQPLHGKRQTSEFQIKKYGKM